MTRVVRSYWPWCWLSLLAGVAVLIPETATRAETIQYPIVVDTQLDSQASTANFGASTSAKVVVNGNDGSLARALFQIPNEAWSQAGSLASAKVYFHVWNDQTGERNVQLCPLTHAFVEGTGQGSGTADGATWLTYDGFNAWASPGGDFNSVLAVDGTALDDGDIWFTWDITSLWNNTDLRDHGAILMMSDESSPGAGIMPRAPFSSSESTGYPHPYLEITMVPEPGAWLMLLAGGMASIFRRARNRNRGSRTIATTAAPPQRYARAHY